MKLDPITKQAQGLMGMLVVQYLLGMYTNMFVAFPQRQSVTGNWEFAKTQWPVILHILVGLGLLIGSISLVVRAMRRKDVVWRPVAWAGLVSILVAFGAGEEFIGTQNDVISYVMAVGFIAAFLSYGWGLYATHQGSKS